MGSVFRVLSSSACFDFLCEALCPLPAQPLTFARVVIFTIHSKDIQSTSQALLYSCQPFLKQLPATQPSQALPHSKPFPDLPRINPSQLPMTYAIRLTGSCNTVF